MTKDEREQLEHIFAQSSVSLLKLGRAIGVESREDWLWLMGELWDIKKNLAKKK